MNISGVKIHLIELPIRYVTQKNRPAEMWPLCGGHLEDAVNAVCCCLCWRPNRNPISTISDIIVWSTNCLRTVFCWCNCYSITIHSHCIIVCRTIRTSKTITVRPQRHTAQQQNIEQQFPFRSAISRLHNA